MTARRPTLSEAVSLMGSDDAALATAAVQLLDARYEPRRHEVAAAAITVAGGIVTGLHVEVSQGRASVCAESGVASAAAARGEGIVALVAVLRREDGSDHLIEPCGVCAELLAEHWPAARVWVARSGTPQPITALDLLPYRHDRTGRVAPPTKENPA